MAEGAAGIDRGGTEMIEVFGATRKGRHRVHRRARPAFAQAARVSEQVRAELRSHGHAHTVALCNFFAVVWPEFWSGDFEACERHSAELVAYCTEKKAEYYRLLGAIYHASARAAREPTEENIAALRAAIDAQHQSGARCGDSGFISRLAEALLMAGDVTPAERALQDSFAFVEQSGERFGLAELHRISGQIALKRGEPDRAWAEACFLHAIEIAGNQEANMLELRAAIDLARLWREAGSDRDPRALLEPILARIEGGETARDVHNARDLLAEIL
jgi:predicted ATPase